MRKPLRPRPLSKEAAPICDLFKQVPSRSSLKYKSNEHESLGIFFGTPIFSTLKILSFFIQCPKNGCKENLEFPSEFQQDPEIDK
jgi:hypothetical protein